MKISLIDQKVFRVKNNVVAHLTFGLNAGHGIIKNSINEFEGIAKRNPEDTFDFKTGKRIAVARAEIRAYQFYKRYLKEYNEVYQQLADETSDLFFKLNKQITHNKEYIADIVCGSND